MTSTERNRLTLATVFTARGFTVILHRGNISCGILLLCLVFLLHLFSGPGNGNQIEEDRCGLGTFAISDGIQLVSSKRLGLGSVSVTVTASVTAGPSHGAGHGAEFHTEL